MSYCTYDDLVNAFGKEEILQLTDRDRNRRQDNDVLEEAIAFAESLVDGYLRERYAVPLMNPPKNLVGIVTDIVRYRLYNEQPTELVVIRYEAAIQWLKDVARGLVRLDITDPVVSTLAYSTPVSIFTKMGF